MKQKTWSKWSKLYQTMCFDTDLQMKIVYSGVVIILWLFLAFYGPKRLLFVTRDTKYSILKQKTWSKMEKPLPDFVFWYCPQMTIIYSDWVMNLWPFLAFCGSKRLFLPPEAQILNFEKENMVKMEQSLPDYVIWYCPSD